MEQRRASSIGRRCRITEAAAGYFIERATQRSSPPIAGRGGVSLHPASRSYPELESDIRELFVVGDRPLRLPFLAKHLGFGSARARRSPESSWPL